ncbi:Na+/H+ antiporter subunit A [Streptomyces sp. NPDC020141]|uniref:Na+/H+ antiporter subunit A n=1 Tax=Streptomyces sp. NPDC020141 TaxID=3365065 RepID=UPI0037BA48B7
MAALILCHFLLAACAGPLVGRLGPRAFVVLALPPAAAAVWAAAQWGRAASGGSVGWSLPWLPDYGVWLALRLDALSLLMVLLAAGVGALVLLYCVRYFAAGTLMLGRFAGNLLAFAGAMLGLVLADDLVLLYVFWELTTVFSYLLIGHGSERKQSRRSALQALTVTAFGGLAMLVGFLMLGGAAGTYRISALVADPPAPSTTVSVAVVLILLGALSKSAIWPFSLWLPNAMAAPTPVSAYLHAAAMVKAGVYLIARLAPAFADAPPWRPLLLTLGALTMLLGGWRALRLNDLKLVLAYGTVSQLGFLTVLAGAGHRDTALAAAAMILAHALFKAPLFLVTGIVDHATGTRDLRRLSGVGRALPRVAAVAVVAGASMAGLPPLLGFAAKEAAFTALEHGSAAERWTLAVCVVGSALTTAYTLRFLWGAFARKPGLADTPAHPVDAAFLGPPAVLAAGCVVLGPGVVWLNGLLGAYADAFPPPAHPYSLSLWHGLGVALMLSGAAWAGGLALFAARGPVVRLSRRVAWPTADRVFGLGLLGLERLALQVTGFFQRGSLPVYLATVLLVLLAGQLTVLLVDRPWHGAEPPRLWDSPVQGAIALLTCLAALLCLQVRRRMKAVVMAGLTGYGTALLFVVQGAPDLALTQFCVETVSLLVFVLVLRRMPVYFQETISRWRLMVRVPLALAAAAAVSVVLWVMAAARRADPAGRALVYETAHHGVKDVVATILVEYRAWDTLGESAVLAVAAVGVTSLIYFHRRTGSPDDSAYETASAPPRTNGPRANGPQPAGPRANGPQTNGPQAGRTAWSFGSGTVTPVPAPDDNAPERTWLAAGRTLAPEYRSVVFEVVARLVFHPILVLSVYLLFCAENLPGGGFVGGLVAGVAMMARYLAGGRYELGEAAPGQPGLFIGLGLFLSTGVALLGLFDGTALHAFSYEGHWPLFGDFHLGTPVLFDAGVYLLVLGVVLDIVRALGARVDRQIEREAAAREAAGREAGR